ncbi:MAG TPA: 23S rRNA (pseudouridine(1915)-N(3))-methyltransferase RlmH [Alphaproteobacteria bacterium]|jgi:23S rRNA (pseudouridine1915-N3)-methyltransferase|nr:23S rRNA (pseudouridine(1915)-N(3))-methyltransferase RlmH [Alphaproteobacteria bacterium]
MRLWLAAVGRAGSDPARALFDHYSGRLSPPLTLREVVPRKNVAPERLAEEEGRLLLAAVPGGAVIVALDEKGKALSSQAFAGRMGAWRDDGVKDLAFLIGGADGLAAKVRHKAALTLSMGPMTWPHLLARAMLAEQLYRAQTILAGHPYHRG